MLESEDQMKWKSEKLGAAIGFILILGLIVYAIQFNQEIDDYGIITEATVIDCKMKRISGSCIVLIEYHTNLGERKVSKQTLYNEDNCLLGQRLQIKYSTISERIEVIGD